MSIPPCPTIEELDELREERDVARIHRHIAKENLELATASGDTRAIEEAILKVAACERDCLDIEREHDECRAKRIAARRAERAAREAS